jgi:hypothetical protein
MPTNKTSKMKMYKIAFPVSILILCASLMGRAQSITPTQSANNIVEYSPTVRDVKDEASITLLPVEQVAWSVNYFDGLGRVIQRVVPQVSPSKKDMVTSIQYDSRGREPKKYLPYVSEGVSGAHRPHALGTTSYESSPHYQFYNPLTPGKTANDEAPFSVVVFEPSTESRVVKQGAVGTAWRPDPSTSYYKESI